MRQRHCRILGIDAALSRVGFHKTKPRNTEDHHGRRTSATVAGALRAGSGREGIHGWENRIPGWENRIPGWEDRIPGWENRIPGWENRIPGWENRIPGWENRIPGWENRKRQGI